jgi:hypothetical protein
VSFLNGEINSLNYWDPKFGKYLFINRKVKVLAGGNGFTYSQFETISTGIVDSYDCDDRRITFNLRDLRDGINKTLPIDKYTVTEFARLDEQSEDRPKAFWYGDVTNAVPTCIDTTNRIFEFHAGRIKSVEYVYQNGATLTAGTDYFIDYQRGRIILARGLIYSANDIILVDFTGAVTDADEVIQTGAHIFKHLLNTYMDIADTDLDLDSIWATHVAKTTALTIGAWKDTDSQDLIRRIERSIEAYTFQSADGKLGIKVPLTTAPTDIFYVPNEYILGFSMGRNKASLYSLVNVYYGEDASIDKYALQQVTNNQLNYKHKVSQPLDVYTALNTSALAATLGSNIVALLDRARITFTVNRSLFTHQPGDLIYFTRDRFYDQSSTASNKLLRILSISKLHSSGRTEITAEVVE